MKKKFKKVSVLLLILFLFTTLNSCLKIEFPEDNNSLEISSEETQQSTDITSENSSESSIPSDNSKTQNESSLSSSNNPISKTPEKPSEKPVSHAAESEKPSLNEPPKEEQFVFVSVYGLDRAVILKDIKFPYSENISAFTATVKSLKDKNIPVDFSGNNQTGYIKGINGLSEFDYGATSGWIYLVNGDKKGGNIGAGRRILKENDHVEWYYIKSSSEKI